MKQASLKFCFLYFYESVSLLRSAQVHRFEKRIPSKISEELGPNAKCGSIISIIEDTRRFIQTFALDFAFSFHRSFRQLPFHLLCSC